MGSGPAVSVLVPRAGTCPSRQRAWAWVRSQLEEFEVVEGWSDPHRWCKAEAVDQALERASGDLLIIHDADVWSEHLDAAIDAVRSGRAMWSSPHRHVRRLTEDGTNRFIAGERESAPVEESHYAMLGGGIVVVARETYERAPLDRRFVGWGGEDQAFAAALRTMAGVPFIGRQPLWHLWHPPQERKTRKIGNETNDVLRAKYVAAKLSRRRMSDVIEEGRACRSTGSSSRR